MSHAALLSSTTADHALEVQRLREDLNAAREDKQQNSQSIEQAVAARQAGEEDLAQIKAELDEMKKVFELAEAKKASEATANGQEGKEEEGRLKKVIADLRDEMDGTKMVCCAI